MGVPFYIRIFHDVPPKMVATVGTGPAAARPHQEFLEIGEKLGQWSEDDLSEIALLLDVSPQALQRVATRCEAAV